MSHLTITNYKEYEVMHLNTCAANQVLSWVFINVVTSCFKTVYCYCNMGYDVFTSLFMITVVISYCEWFLTDWTNMTTVDYVKDFTQRFWKLIYLSVYLKYFFFFFFVVES